MIYLQTLSMKRIFIILGGIAIIAIVIVLLLGRELSWQEKDGIQFRVQERGEGKEVRTGDTVLVHYTGKLKDGTVFDSSRTRNEAFPFVLGKGQVIQGWEIGIEGMNVGEKRLLSIPSELAYGSEGVPGLIPPNAVLLFEVEIMSILSDGN